MCSSACATSKALIFEMQYSAAALKGMQLMMQRHLERMLHGYHESLCLRLWRFIRSACMLGLAYLCADSELTTLWAMPNLWLSRLMLVTPGTLKSQMGTG